MAKKIGNNNNFKKIHIFLQVEVDYGVKKKRSGNQLTGLK
jgi:hypothetical protein